MSNRFSALPLILLLLGGAHVSAAASPECPALKRAAAARYLTGVIKCRRTGPSGTTIYSTCAQRAGKKLVSAFNHAEAKPTCTTVGDATAIADEADSFVESSLFSVEAPEICDNSIDDNGNEAVDCADFSCSNAPACNRCGNGVTEAPLEQCDGVDLRGMDCTSAFGGPATGILRCDPVTCLFDTADCIPQ